jgi:hypothetical protein
MPRLLQRGVLDESKKRSVLLCSGHATPVRNKLKIRHQIISVRDLRISWRRVSRLWQF